MDYTARTIRAYDEVDVDKYEKATHDICATLEADRFVDLLSDKDGTVVDAGCAFGRDVSMLADRGVNVIGVDASAKFLLRARELYPALRFEQMDIRNLRFADHSLSGIWCHATLLHFKDADLQVVLAEYRRALTAGGVLFATFKEGEGEEEIVENFTSNSVRFFNYQSQESVRHLLESGGFDVVDMYRVNEQERWQKRDLNWVYCFALNSA